MTIKRKTGRRIVAALVAMGATAGMAGAFAAPAAAADRTSGHFDVAAEVECDVFGQVSDVAVHVHEHVNGGEVELPEGDWLTFTGTSGPEVGFAVEPGASCGTLDVEFEPNVLDSSSTGGTVSGTGAAGSISSSKTDASGSVVLDGSGHEDLAWSFSGTGTYLLTFDVTVNGSVSVLSEDVPLKRS
ncbi:hypothetical protein [Myceligenerans pegani]|uniref:Uncharacterized protein n=1 Tax=Myceligenerans pegani TaxID=2776917 RepID=A0ABR9N325_9MICO|nr:hypothetical protein [Myceligenerans sp. TRM 65318]MBE1878058.1 hypothetical protein [Myceligenerans sp. TRM 65318]MBE3020329.1 hypothetical protein [Myceligenerans sp. TRM 65318]